MLNSNATRALLCGLICCAPALAIIPPEVLIRVGGAEPLGPYHFAVVASSTVGVAVEHEPNDIIWLFAVARDRNGEADPSRTLTLFLDRCPDGRMYLEQQIPEGLAGLSFQIQAMTLSPRGEVHSSTEVVIDVVARPVVGKDSMKTVDDGSADTGADEPNVNDG